MKKPKMQSIKPINPDYVANYCEDVWDTSKACTFTSKVNGEKVKGYRDYSQICIKNSQIYANIYVYYTYENRIREIHGYKFDVPEEFAGSQVELEAAVHDFVSRENARSEEKNRSIK